MKVFRLSKTSVYATSYYFKHGWDSIKNNEKKAFILNYNR